MSNNSYVDKASKETFKQPPSEISSNITATSPVVSVYIPSHNYGRFLKSAIESVLRQSYGSWELLIIDDGSSDSTSEVIRLYQSDTRIRTFRTEGIGLHGVCNLALSEARGRYIIRLDGDDVFDENILLVLVQHLESNPEDALVFSDYYLVDEFGEILSHERREKLYEKNHMLDSAPNGACFLARREVLLAVGGYRDDLRSQDGYHIWTLLRARYRCANINLPLFFYRQHGTNLTSKAERILESRRIINRDAVKNTLADVRPISLVIPARRNYDFCQDVWSRTLNGKSLLSIAVKLGLSSRLFDHIIVACDNPAAAEVVRAYQDPRLIFLLRDSRETLRSEKLAKSIGRVVAAVDPAHQGITVISYLQTPLVRVETLEEAVYNLLINQADCSAAVEEVTRPIYQRTHFGLRAINPPRGIRSDFEAVYADAMTVRAVRNANLLTGSLEGPRVAHFIISSDETFFISSEEELQIAEIQYRHARSPAVALGGGGT